MKEGSLQNQGRYAVRLATCPSWSNQQEPQWKQQALWAWRWRVTGSVTARSGHLEMLPVQNWGRIQTSDPSKCVRYHFWIFPKLCIMLYYCWQAVRVLAPRFLSYSTFTNPFSFDFDLTSLFLDSSQPPVGKLWLSSPLFCFKFWLCFFVLQQGVVSSRSPIPIVDSNIDFLIFCVTGLG